MEKFPKSSKLDHVCYDIRGLVHKKVLQLEEEGHKILKLNIGNPAPFGFEAPDEILVDVIRNLPTAQGYCDSKGLYSTRKAIVHYYQTKGLRDISVNDVYIGNGVSELITMSMQALLNDGYVHEELGFSQDTSTLATSVMLVVYIAAIYKLILGKFFL